MNNFDILLLLPLIVLAASALLVMLSIAIKRSHPLAMALTLVGLGAALIAALWVWREPASVTLLLAIDHYALFYTVLLLSAALLITLLSYGYLERQGGRREEYYVLLLLATLGAATLAASNHFASFFLGLELLSVSLYALIAYPRDSQLGIEAAIKYLVLAGVSSAFLLFGMALVYASLGSMEISRLAVTTVHGNLLSILAITGFGLILVGIGFKLALVPFHFWTPDVYQGAPPPVAAFIATVSKGAVFALLLRYFSAFQPRNVPVLLFIFTLLAIFSMFVGNLLALMQNNIKRILAYSSISHMGYLLVAFLASGAFARTAVTFYLVAYFAATLGAFGVVTELSSRFGEMEDLTRYHGVAWRYPWLAGVLTLSVLSLAGIPITAGFLGKLYLVTAGVSANLWLLVIILVINSAIGLYYYLRIVIAMYRYPGREPAQIAENLPPPEPVPLLGGIALGVVAIVLVWLGTYPAPLLDIIRRAVRF